MIPKQAAGAVLFADISGKAKGKAKGARLD
jgi:hypothetical protein